MRFLFSFTHFFRLTTKKSMYRIYFSVINHVAPNSTLKYNEA